GQQKVVPGNGRVAWYGEHPRGCASANGTGADHRSARTGRRMAVDAEFAETLTVGPLYAHPREQRVRSAGNPMKLRSPSAPAAYRQGVRQQNTDAIQEWRLCAIGHSNGSCFQEEALGWTNHQCPAGAVPARGRRDEIGQTTSGC